MKRICTLLAFLAISLSGGRLRAQEPQPQVRQQQVQMLHGGKQRFPVELRVVGQGGKRRGTYIPPDTWTLVRVLLLPGSGCESLNVTFSGRDGLEIENPGQVHALGACKPEGHAIDLQVRLPANEAGRISAQMQMGLEDSGRSMAASTSVLVATARDVIRKGARLHGQRREASKVQEGEQTTRDGRPLQVIESN